MSAATSTAAGLFLQLLYGRGRGYVELAWIDGDPDDREHGGSGPGHSRWSSCARCALASSKA